MSQVEAALKLSTDDFKARYQDDFKARYQHDLPSSDQEVIFSCKLGGRAQKAADQAVALGFKK